MFFLIKLLLINLKGTYTYITKYSMWKSLNISKISQEKESINDAIKLMDGYIKKKYEEPVIPTIFGTMHVELLPNSVLNLLRVYFDKGILTRRFHEVTCKIEHNHDMVGRLNYIPEKLMNIRLAPHIPLKQYKVTYTNKNSKKEHSPVYAHSLFPELKDYMNNDNLFYLSAGSTIEVDVKVVEQMECEDSFIIHDGKPYVDPYNITHKFGYQQISDGTELVGEDGSVITGNEEKLDTTKLYHTGMVIHSYPGHKDDKKSLKMNDILDGFKKDCVKFFKTLLDNMDKYYHYVEIGYIDIKYPLADFYLRVLQAYMAHKYGHNVQVSNSGDKKCNVGLYQFLKMSRDECKKTIEKSISELIVYFK